MRTAFSFALLSTLAAPLGAQVGHAPGSSPYREIVNGHSFAVVTGYFAGGGGEFGIGPHNGFVHGVRYDLRAGKTIQFGFSAAQGQLPRYVIDPFVSLDRRVVGVFDQRTTFADVSIQLNVTGAKTWHRLAPYSGITLGVALGKDVAADTSGYDFGTKFYFAPQLGTRVFLGSSLHLRAEIRGVFWKVNYPLSFGDEPVGEPGTPESPNAVIPDARFDEWTVSPWVQVGLGYLFRF